jgi:hypothetical protein
MKLKASLLFALSSQYPAGTAGRQIIWVWFIVLACLTVVAGAFLPGQPRKKDDEQYLDRQEEVDESTALLD